MSTPSPNALPNHHESPVDPTEQIQSSGSATFLFIIGSFLSFFGFMIFLGTESRNYFDGAAVQATLGAAIFTIGALSLLSATILAGVNGIVRRHTQVLLAAQAERTLPE